MDENTAITVCVVTVVVAVATIILTSIVMPGTPKTCIEEQKSFAAMCAQQFKDPMTCLEKIPTCEKTNDQHSSKDDL
jgi:hypothetical protein